MRVWFSGRTPPCQGGDRGSIPRIRTKGHSLALCSTASSLTLAPQGICVAATERNAARNRSSRIFRTVENSGDMWIYRT